MSAMTAETNGDLVLHSQSRYERLLRGDIGGEDITLIFAANESDAEASSKKLKEREISAHRAFVRQCGLIRAALEKDHQFAESASGQVRIVLPPGSALDAVDGLLGWCYDGRLKLNEYVRRTEFLVLERYATGIPALWILADFVQCRDLCDEIVAILKAGRLRSGRSFAALVDEAGDTAAADSLIGAALEGLPIQLEQRKELEETWFDFGSAEMLAALSKVYSSPLVVDGIGEVADAEEGKGEDSPADDSSNSTLVRDETSLNIAHILGEYLAEMKRADRAKMTPVTFARCLTKFPAGTVAEADYATIILDYMEDRLAGLASCTNSGISDACMVAMLGSIDFSVISQTSLKHNIIPRIDRIFPSYALVVNDFVAVASTIVARCSFSSQILSKNNNIIWAPCGAILSMESIQYLFPSYVTISRPSGGRGGFISDYSTSSPDSPRVTRMTEIYCPFCRFRLSEDQHNLRRRDFIKYESPDANFFHSYNPQPGTLTRVTIWPSKVILHNKNPVETERLNSYFERKRTKSESLKRWVFLNAHNEDEVVALERQKKRARTETANLFSESVGPCVRILNQCSSRGQESVFFYDIDPDPRGDNVLDSDVGIIIDKFATEVGLQGHARFRDAYGMRDLVCFFRSEADGSLGARIPRETTWRQLEFNLQGDDTELIIARVIQSG